MNVLTTECSNDDKVKKIKKLSDRIKERKQEIISKQKYEIPDIMREDLMTTFEYFNKGNNTEQSDEHLHEDRKRIHS